MKQHSPSPSGRVEFSNGPAVVGEFGGVPLPLAAAVTAGFEG